MKRIVYPAILGLLLAAPSAVAEDAPAKSSGLAGSLLAEMSLAPEFQATEGRIFRMRRLTLEPGGVVALHSHEHRPSLEYVIAGTATEFRDGKTRRVTQGDVIAADHEMTHWWRNDGDETVIILAVDIYEPEEADSATPSGK